MNDLDGEVEKGSLVEKLAPIVSAISDPTRLLPLSRIPEEILPSGNQVIRDPALFGNHPATQDCVIDTPAHRHPLVW